MSSLCKVPFLGVSSDAVNTGANQTTLPVDSVLSKLAFSKLAPLLHNCTASFAHAVTFISPFLTSGDDWLDAVMLQTVHDFPRWADEGALLPYMARGFDQVHPEIKDRLGRYTGVLIFNWVMMWNENKIKTADAPREWPDYLNPALKDKLVLTYPNDDDAVLFAFDLIMQQYGETWLDGLIAQNPRWVRGTATTNTLLARENDTSAAASFIGSFGAGAEAPAPFQFVLPTDGQFVSWAQTAAILKQGAHPEGAKLLINFLLSDTMQSALGGWSVRKDFVQPESFPFPANIMAVNNTSPVAFQEFMADRARMERLRLWIESKIGTAQGLSPLEDDI